MMEYMCPYGAGSTWKQVDPPKPEVEVEVWKLEVRGGYVGYRSPEGNCLLPHFLIADSHFLRFAGTDPETGYEWHPSEGNYFRLWLKEKTKCVIHWRDKKGVYNKPIFAPEAHVLKVKE